MPVKDTYFHGQLSKMSGTQKEWNTLIALVDRKSVRGVLNSIDDDYQDINALLRRKLKEKPFKVKKAERGKYKNYLVIGCIHRPHHSKKLWAKIMQLIYDMRKDIHGIIINGDYLEIGAISNYGIGKKGDGITLMDEYEDGLDGIMEIESALGKYKKEIDKHFIYGNHEERFNKYMGKLEPSKYGDALLNPVKALRLIEFGYNVQTDYQNAFVQLGNDLEVFHGTYFGVNAASKHLSEGNNVSQIFNHTHRFQSFSKNGQTAYNVGCLINLKSNAFNYANRPVRSNWRNGFAMAHVSDNGDHEVTPIQCKNESFFFWGKKY